MTGQFEDQGAAFGRAADAEIAKRDVALADLQKQLDTIKNPPTPPSARWIDLIKAKPSACLAPGFVLKPEMLPGLASFGAFRVDDDNEAGVVGPFNNTNAAKTCRVLANAGIPFLICTAYKHYANLIKGYQPFMPLLTDRATEIGQWLVTEKIPPAIGGAYFANEPQDAAAYWYQVAWPTLLAAFRKTAPKPYPCVLGTTDTTDGGTFAQWYDILNENGVKPPEDEYFYPTWHMYYDGSPKGAQFTMAINGGPISLALADPKKTLVGGIKAIYANVAKWETKFNRFAIQSECGVKVVQSIMDRAWYIKYNEDAARLVKHPRFYWAIGNGAYEMAPNGVLLPEFVTALK